MFEKDYIVTISVDRFMAESARALLWDYKALRPQDAIHVASAIKAKAPIFDTFDEYLIGLTGTVGEPPLTIGKPNVPYQEALLEETKSEQS